jgi:hypothetical protein
MGWQAEMYTYFIAEPYLWLQSCFFQPVRFKQSLESQRVSERLTMMGRLTPLLFLYSYTPALITRILIYSLHPDLYPHYTLQALIPFNPVVGWFLIDATWATALSCLIAALVGGVFSIRFGIASALALGIANGIIVNTSNDTLVGIIFGLAFGLMLGITFNSASAIKQGGIEDVTVASGLGIVAGLIIGFLAGTIVGYWAGFACGALYPVLQYADNIVGSTAGLTVGGITACLIAALLAMTVRKIIKGKETVLSVGIHVGIAVAGAFGAAIGIPVGDAGVSHSPFMEGVTTGMQAELIVGIGFLLCYLLSYYRLPLYPISAYSTIQAYLVSRSKLQLALFCLRHSSLHWDECVFLPLPYLKNLLLLASEQNMEGTLSEINFIVQERSQQRRAAQAVAYELALRDFEQRTILRDIGLAHQQLALLVPQQLRALSTSAEKVFRHLDDASREAASYHTQTNKQDRQAALERMLNALHKIHPHTAFGSVKLNRYLRTVVTQWRISAEQGKDTLGSMSGHFYIDNPYTPGNPLELRDPLFVGRDDIVQKLGQALQKRYRPTFLLMGERRMGKSSILKQLPVLLGPRYLPVFYDLQTPGMLASTAAFFAAITAGIEKQLKERGVLVHKLERGLLDELQQHGEIQVYDRCELWLAEVEQTLEQIDRMLVLSFDEFEKLEDAEERGSINLKLLFDWFRSLIQNHTRLALLFSGAKMGGDMGRSWAGYFVNVERIKVSFLREADARDLIVRPVPHIFDEEITKEIMRVTRCHPFLIQAVCKHIIEFLNNDSREFATLGDVSTAIQEVFESWTVYFWDLWDRCDQDQRACLIALSSLGHAAAHDIMQQNGLSKQKTFHALEKLQMRDIVTSEQNAYRFAVPMLTRWVEQNLHLLELADEH